MGMILYPSSQEPGGVITIAVTPLDAALDFLAQVFDLDTPDPELLAQPTFDAEPWTDQNASAIVWDGTLDADASQSVQEIDEVSQSEPAECWQEQLWWDSSGDDLDPQVAEDEEIQQASIEDAPDVLLAITDFEMSGAIPEDDPIDCTQQADSPDLQLFWDISLDGIDPDVWSDDPFEIPIVADGEAWQPVDIQLLDVAFDFDLANQIDREPPVDEDAAEPTWAMEPWVVVSETILWDSTFDYDTACVAPEVEYGDDQGQEPIEMDAWADIPVVVLYWDGSLDLDPSQADPLNDSIEVAQNESRVEPWLEQLWWDGSLDAVDLQAFASDDEIQQPDTIEAQADTLINAPNFIDWLAEVDEDLQHSIDDPAWYGTLVTPLVDAPDTVLDQPEPESDPFALFESFEPWSPVTAGAITYDVSADQDIAWLVSEEEEIAALSAIFASEIGSEVVEATAGHLKISRITLTPRLAAAVRLAPRLAGEIELDARLAGTITLRRSQT